MELIQSGNENYLCQVKEKFVAQVTLPGSKSISNRALILAALSERKVELYNFLKSDDTDYMVSALKSMGFEISSYKDNSTVTISPGEKLSYSNLDLYVGNAGTAMRFLVSFLLTKKSEVVLRGNLRMNQRPIKELIEAAEKLGAKIEYLEHFGFPPIKIISFRKTASSVTIDCDKSSQFLSSLLLSAPYFSQNLDIFIKNKIVSKPYVDMSTRMISDFGGLVKEVDLNRHFHVSKGEYSLTNYLIEGDMSAASYFIALSLVTNSIVTIDNYFKKSIQGDSIFLDIFLKLGGSIVSQSDTSITIKGCQSYPGMDIDLNNAPDIAQTLAIVALFATSETTIRNVGNMRIKETDRITALKNEIERIGGEFIEYPEGFKVIPKTNYNGGYIETYDDHRMAMSFSIAGFRIPNLIIKDFKCVSKTFPHFFNILDNIYRN